MSLPIEQARKVNLHRLLGLSPGRRTAIKCVFHSDKTPSLVIYKDNGFHCFGCGAHGKNAIDFCMRLGMSFPEAVKQLTT